MTDKETILAEIERRYNCEKCYPNDREASVAAAVLQELLLFIDSLPEEPKCIYNRTLDERKKFCRYCSAACSVRIEEEPVSEDLERAADSYASTFCENSRKVAYEAYKMGAKWKEKQLMKDAADSKITTDGNSIFPIIKYQLPLTYDCKIGDKVKLIILRESML